MLNYSRSSPMESVDLSTAKHQVPKELLEPFTYVTGLKGKGVRTILLEAFNLWLNIPITQLQEISKLVSILHNASLMIDDIEDSSQLRRGVPVTHMVYGIPTTLNTANYMYFVAMEMGRQIGGEGAINIILEEIMNLHRGQGWDIYWRDNNICPTEDQYKQMVLDKTGGLFRLGLRLLQLFSEVKKDFIPLVNSLGLYYQIRDDYINLHSVNYAQNKSFAEDLTEGKYSFPIIHGINNRKDTQLLRILCSFLHEDLCHQIYSFLRSVQSFILHL
eukprot:TRINITY_DN479_c0_g2_i6.p1 TRINITY_DN479_c0_g2~~TRINITY_DN479_c0_g2_i6.p1  ORF type:complete len:274 (+),score=32.50 TRINITY_DN479_c0_g2_i6:114-935(+)